MILRNMAVFARSLHLGRFAFAALFLFVLVSGAWGACTVRGFNSTCDGASRTCTKCPGFSGNPSYSIDERVNCNVVGCSNPNIEAYIQFSCSGAVPGYMTSGRCQYSCVGSGGSSGSFTFVTCDTQCEADSVACVNQGYTWADDPSASCGKSCSQCDEQCQCVEQGMIWTGTECIEDTTVCNTYREECQRAKGVFNGSVNSGQCVATCNQCKELNRLVRLKQDQCCNQGLAPPDSVRRCTIEARNTPGMNWSTYTTSDNEFACQDPSLSDAASSRYVEMCFEQSSSSEGPSPGSSSSGEGGTSSGGGISSGGEYGDCQECPWLDSILDTLTRTKKNTDDIVTCLTTPNLCAGLSIQIPDSIKTPVFAFDTAFRKYLKPLMDSSLKLDSNQLKALMKLDTNLLKQIKNDSAALRNDTNTWRVVEGAGDRVDTSVHSMNDTTRKWFKRIADSIGVSTDSLAAHIDSIVRHIPDSILDSIVKYQQYATDNFDSVLFGHGKGFSLVDSLIDSSVKYFKESNQKWNEYVSMYGDSTQKIHEEIIDLPGRNASAIGSALGYGDTSTSTLRGDLEGIRGAIEGLGDTNGLGGHGGGYGDSLGRYRDSINKYYISDERFGELVDSTEAAWGVDSLDARWDSSYAYGLCNGDDCPPCSDDSCMGSLSGNFVQRADSIARIAGDSLEASTKRQRDSLPTFWDSTFKELKQYSWFGSFDSTFLANIGAKIPNSNTCPEHCFAQDVNGTYAYVAYNMHLDWKLCRPIAPNVLNSLNAFDILKLLARVLTVVTCLSILMWEVSSRRGGGIGL